MQLTMKRKRKAMKTFFPTIIIQINKKIFK